VLIEEGVLDSRTSDKPVAGFGIHQDLRAHTSSKRGIEPAFGYPPVSRMIEGGGVGSTMSSISSPYLPISWTYRLRGR